MWIDPELYPLDFPPVFGGPNDLELAVGNLKHKLRSVAIQTAQIRREAGLNTISSLLQGIAEVHDILPRSNTDNVLGTKGLYAGGEQGNTLLSAVHRLNYLVETVSLSSASLSRARTSAAAVSTAISGYFGGGADANGAASVIDRIGLKDEAGTTISARLSEPTAELAAIGTPAKSCFFGGQNLTGGFDSFRSTIQALSHPQQTIRVLAARLLLNSRSNVTAIGNAGVAHLCGGKSGFTGSGGAFRNDVDTFNYETEEISMSGRRISQARAFSVGGGNSVSGFVIGGLKADGASSVIDEYNYQANTVAPIAAALATPKGDAAATGSSAELFIAGGGTTSGGEFKAGGALRVFERFRYEAKTLSPMNVQLTGPITGMAATGDYSPGVNIGQVANDDDQNSGLYAKADHHHDDRYSLLGHTHHELYAFKQHSHSEYLTEESGFSVNIGDIIMTARRADQIPANFLPCDGRALNSNDYPELFAVLAPEYGSVGTSTTFYLPNFSGSTPIGVGTSPSSGQNYTVNTKGGRDFLTLTTAQLPAHGHSVTVSDTGHTHTINDPSHAHTINDPQHQHQISNIKRAVLNNVTNDGAGSELSAQGTGAQLMANAASTGISINGALTGISINGSGSGISASAANTGSGQAIDIRSPFIGTRFIIRVK